MQKRVPSEPFLIFEMENVKAIASHSQTNLSSVIRFLQTKKTSSLVELRHDVGNEYAVFAVPKKAAVITVFRGVDASEVLFHVVRTRHKLFPSTTRVVLVEGLEEKAMEEAVERELGDLC